MKGNAFVGFIPWIIFWVLAGPSTWEWATLGATIAAVILAIPSIERGRPKILEIFTIIVFGGLSLISLFIDHAALSFLEDYAQVISNGLLAVIALGSLLFTPFTEQYARETVLREVWNSPVFKRTNRVLTAMWGTIFLLSALCRLAADIWPSGSELFQWIIPIALIVGGLKFMAWYIEHVRREQRAPDASESRPVY